MEKQELKDKGITLVALIITIIILIILAAVSIYIFTNSNIVNLALDWTINYVGAQREETEFTENVAGNLDNTVGKIGEVQSTNTPEESKKPEETKEPEEIVKELEEPKIEITELTNTSFKINITNEYEADIEFEYYINGVRQGQRTSNKSCLVKNLDFNTEYNIKVIAYRGEEQKVKEMTQKTKSDGKLILFDKGEQYIDVTGGWTNYSTIGESVTKAEIRKFNYNKYMGLLGR